MDRVVLLGTGTDVGKTYLGVALARALRTLGRSVLGLKPVESGLDGFVPDVLPQRGDAFDLAAAADHGAAPRYGFRRPVSPHLAAREEGVSLSLESVVEWVDRQEKEFLRTRPDRPIAVIETAGGCFSPLSETRTNFDLMRALDPATCILVAPDSLGVLHDVQATLRSVVSRPPELLVLCEARARDESTGTNLTEVERVVLPQLATVLPLPEVHSIARGGDAVAVGQALLSRFGTQIDL